MEMACTWQKKTQNQQFFVDFEAPFGGGVFSMCQLKKILKFQQKNWTLQRVLQYGCFSHFILCTVSKKSDCSADFLLSASACPPPLSPALLPSTEAAACH